MECDKKRDTFSGWPNPGGSGNKVKIFFLKLLGIACGVLRGGGGGGRLDRALVKWMSHKGFVKLQNFRGEKPLGGALVK